MGGVVMRRLMALGLGVLLSSVSGPVLAAASSDQIETAEKPAADKPGAASKTLADAQERMKTIAAGVWRIKHLLPRAQGRPFRASCVSQKLTEAKIHVQLAEDEMAVFARAVAPGGAKGGQAKPEGGNLAADREHALHRLDLLARRTSEIERSARECVDDDLSGIQVTKVEVIKEGQEIEADPPRAILVSPNR